MAGATWNCCHLGAFCVHHTLCHFMQSHIRKVHAYLAVTCNLHFWQNDWDLLRATVVTRGWNGYRNKSQHRRLTLEKKMFPPLLQGFEPTTFQSRVRRSNQWAIPAPRSCNSIRSWAAVERFSTAVSGVFSCHQHRQVLQQTFLFKRVPKDGFGGIKSFFRTFNPFAAQACNISGLKDAGTRLQTVEFPVLWRLLSMLCVLMKILWHDNAKNKTETVKGFNFCTFIGLFQVTSCQWRG